MKSVASRNQPAASSGFSLRSMLLLVFLLGVGAGATTHVLGNAFAVVEGASGTGTSQQGTTNTGTSTITHNCTLT